MRVRWSALSGKNFAAPLAGCGVPSFGGGVSGDCSGCSGALGCVGSGFSETSTGIVGIAGIVSSPPPPLHAASANGMGECETECERRLVGLHRSLSGGGLRRMGSVHTRGRARQRELSMYLPRQRAARESAFEAGRRPLAAKHALGSPVGGPWGRVRRWRV